MKINTDFAQIFNLSIKPLHSCGQDFLKHETDDCKAFGFATPRLNAVKDLKK